MSLTQEYYNLDNEWSFANSHNFGGVKKIWDDDTTTSFKTGEAAYPWVQINMRRIYLVTKVAILSGEEHLMNLEVRVGIYSMNYLEMRGERGNKRITGNEKCGMMFYGPTLVTDQWVEVDCGLSRVLKGKVLTLQLTERYRGNTALEIASIEVFGWGRTCGSEDPTI